MRNRMPRMAEKLEFGALVIAMLDYFIGGIQQYATE